jgi:hypothetical protein
VVSSADRIPLHLRRAAFSTRCKDFRYYEVLEASLHEQFHNRYLVLHDEASGEWAVQSLLCQTGLAGRIAERVPLIFQRHPQALAGFSQASDDDDRMRRRRR